MCVCAQCVDVLLLSVLCILRFDTYMLYKFTNLTFSKIIAEIYVFIFIFLFFVFLFPLPRLAKYFYFVNSPDQLRLANFTFFPPIVLFPVCLQAMPRSWWTNHTEETGPGGTGI